jgi:hypothetical protein
LANADSAFSFRSTQLLRKRASFVCIFQPISSGFTV